MSDQPTCLEVVPRLPWFVNSTLEADERRHVRDHLIGCSACRSELARTREFYAIVRAQAAAADSPAAPTVRPLAHAARARARRTRVFPWWVTAAAAAGLLWISAQERQDALSYQTPVEASGGSRSAGLNAPADLQNPTASPRDLVFSDNFDDGRMDRWNATSQPAEQL